MQAQTVILFSMDIELEVKPLVQRRMTPASVGHLHLVYTPVTMDDSCSTMKPHSLD